MGLILALDHRIADNVASLRNGRWDKAAYSKADGLLGRTLGVIGLGRIGREVVKRANAFGITLGLGTSSRPTVVREQLYIANMKNLKSNLKSFIPEFLKFLT